METVILNQKLKLSIPEGFKELNDEEKAGMNAYQEVPQWCVRDEERHIILAINWKEHKGIFGKLADARDAAEAMETTFRKLMKSYGYQHDTNLSLKLAGYDMEGFRYTYTAQGIEMTGENLVVRKQKTFYYLYCYYRTELAEESRKTIKEILDSASWNEEAEA